MSTILEDNIITLVINSQQNFPSIMCYLTIFQYVAVDSNRSLFLANDHFRLGLRFPKRCPIEQWL